MFSLINGKGTRAVALIVSLAAPFLSVSGCSVYMEATRPTPVDLSQFHSEQPRDEVVERLGTPAGEVTESDNTNCDLYQLYTHGYGAAGKVPIALLEGAADVFTLGLAEVVTSPVEGATKNQLHPVTFCYKDGKLLRVSEDGHEVASMTTAGTPAPAAQNTAPTVDPPGQPTPQ